MPTYHLHKPHPTREQALAIPLYVRSGKRVLRVTAVNKETRRVICEVEDIGERTYDIADLVHHYGEAGIHHYLSNV